MVDTISTFDLLWTCVIGDYDDYYDDKATAKPKDESREPEQQGREEQEQTTVISQVAKAPKDKLEQKSDGMDKKSKMKLGMSMHSKVPGLKASESKSSAARSEVSEAVSSTLGDLMDAQEILLSYANKLGIGMQDLLNGKSIQCQSKAPGSKASESKSLAAKSKASEAMSSSLGDLKDDQEILLRYANKLGIDIEDLLDGWDRKSKMKLGMTIQFQSKAPGSKASESKSSVARSEVSEAISSQAKLAQKSDASRADVSERNPLESNVSSEQESEAETTRKPDYLVTKELHAPTKSSAATSKVSEAMSSSLGDLKDDQEILLRYANKLGIDMEDLLDGKDRKSKMKLGMSSIQFQSKAPGSKVSESKSSVARSEVSEAISSQTKLAPTKSATEIAQRTPGHVGLKFDSLDSLKNRLAEHVDNKLALQSYEVDLRSQREFVKLVDAYDNVFYCRVGDSTINADKQQPMIAPVEKSQWGEDAERDGRHESDCRGIDHVEIHCPIGTAEKIALFYESVLDATTICIDLGDGTKIAIIAFGNVDDMGKADQSWLFRESEEKVPEYDGHHLAKYVGESAADFEQAYKNAEIAGVVWVNPRFSFDKADTLEGAREWQLFRFKDIIDMETKTPHILFIDHFF